MLERCSFTWYFLCDQNVPLSFHDKLCSVINNVSFHRVTETQVISVGESQTARAAGTVPATVVSCSCSNDPDKTFSIYFIKFAVKNLPFLLSGELKS